MTTQEFSNEFDILYNNVMSNQAPGLDEYEKSIFLTMAQKELIRAYFFVQSNHLMQGYDGNPKRQYDFSNITINKTLTNISEIIDHIAEEEDSSETAPDIVNHFDSRSTLFVAPSDLFLSINEMITDSTGRKFSINPISYDQYKTLMSKPYGYPLKRQAWRLICDKTSYYNTVGYAYSEGEYSFYIQNKYYKPLRIIINYVDGDSVAPVVNELDDIVIIKFTVGIDTDDDSPGVTYWQSYLVSDSALESAGLSDYIYPLTGNYANGDGVWSHCSETCNITMDIEPAVNMSGASIVCPVFELIGRFWGSFTYNIRYVRQPRPIILVDLNNVQEGLSIDGYNEVSECELPRDTHDEILTRAVELAKAHYLAQGTGLGDITALRDQSRTDIGLTQNQQSRFSSQRQQE